MRWGREEQKQRHREKQQLEKSQPEKQKQPTPSPLPHQQQHQRQQDKEGRSSSSSSSSPFSLFTPSSWISKLKQSLTTSKSISKDQQLPIPKQNHHHQQHQLNSPRFRIKPNEPVSQPTRDRRRKLDKSAGAGSTTASGSKAHQVQPLSPTHAARISSVSDHYISFFPSDLDDVVLFPPRRSYERLPGGGFNGLYDAGDRAPDRRRRGMSIDPFGSSRTEPALPELKRSESAKLTRIASDLTTASTVHDSPQVRRPGDVRLRPEKKGIGSVVGSGREEFQLFSSVPEKIRHINTTPASTQSINTAPRGSRLPSDLDQVQDQRRRSFSNGIGHKLRRKSKVRVHSPRVGAGATKKKASTEADLEKPKKVAGKTSTGAPSQLESFAVVKCSSDPRRDFRDSMLEMISELGMARPEELEGLLACYLSLNADEYHDVIVRVFRQVWLDLILDTASTAASSPRQHQRMSA